MNLTYNIQVFGLVQGVWFRASTQEQARRLGLNGWVRNQASGSVEIEASGPQVALDEFVKWCRKGPVLARVDRLEMQVNPNASPANSFEVRHT